MRHHHRRNYRKNFIILPIIFLCLGFFVLYLAVSPILRPFGDIASLIFLEERKSPSEEFDSIFDSAAEKPPVEQTAQETTIDASSFTFPSYGTHFGQISIEGTSISAPLFFGDGKAQLKQGACVYNGSHIPGYGKPILISAHNNTWFHDLGSAQVGNDITIETNYGTYVYQITGTKISPDGSDYDLSGEEETLTLYTCYPFDTLGLTPQRFFVYAKYISGPRINIYE